MQRGRISDLLSNANQKLLLLRGFLGLFYFFFVGRFAFGHDALLACELVRTRLGYRI